MEGRAGDGEPNAQPRRAGPGAPAGLSEVLGHLGSGCSGRLGAAVRRLGSTEGAAWRDGERFRTASTVKVAVHAAVMARAEAGRLRMEARVRVGGPDLVGGSGVLSVLRPGLAPTVRDLCTLMVVVSDNTATNMLIDLVGGTEAVNSVVASLGFPEIVLERRLGYPPPPLVTGRQLEAAQPGRPLATATPASMCRLLEAVRQGSVVSRAASAEIFLTLAHQQDRTGVPRAFLGLTGPGEPPVQWPLVASKTGCVPGCRAEAGVILLPGGTEVAYAVMADDLDDQTMTALSEGDELLGRVGAAVLSHWWQGPGPVPLRPGWP